MSDILEDIFIDFSKDIFENVASAAGVPFPAVILGKVAIEAMTKDLHSVDQDDAVKQYTIKEKIKTSIKDGKPVKITKEEIPILRRAINRTVDTLTWGRIKDVLE